MNLTRTVASEPGIDLVLVLHLDLAPPLLPRRQRDLLEVVHASAPIEGQSDWPIEGRPPGHPPKEQTPYFGFRRPEGAILQNMATPVKHVFLISKTTPEPSRQNPLDLKGSKVALHFHLFHLAGAVHPVTRSETTAPRSPGVKNGGWVSRLNDPSSYIHSDSLTWEVENHLFVDEHSLHRGHFPIPCSM